MAKTTASALANSHPAPIAYSDVGATARLAEIAEILATGLQRAHARKSSALLPGERVFSVEPLARQSGGVAEIEGDTP